MSKLETLIQQQLTLQAPIAADKSKGMNYIQKTAPNGNPLQKPSRE